MKNNIFFPVLLSIVSLLFLVSCSKTQLSEEEIKQEFIAKMGQEDPLLGTVYAFEQINILDQYQINDDIFAKVSYVIKILLDKKEAEKQITEIISRQGAVWTSVEEMAVGLYITQIETSCGKIAKGHLCKSNTPVSIKFSKANDGRYILTNVSIDSIEQTQDK